MDPKEPKGPPAMIAEMGKLLDESFQTHAAHLAAIRSQVGTMAPMLFEWGRTKGREQLAAQIRAGSPN